MNITNITIITHQHGGDGGIGIILTGIDHIITPTFIGDHGGGIPLFTFMLITNPKMKNQKILEITTTLIEMMMVLEILQIRHCHHPIHHLIKIQEVIEIITTLIVVSRINRQIMLNNLLSIEVTETMMRQKIHQITRVEIEILHHQILEINQNQKLIIEAWKIVVTQNHQKLQNLQNRKEAIDLI